MARHALPATVAVIALLALCVLFVATDAGSVHHALADNALWIHVRVDNATEDLPALALNLQLLRRCTPCAPVRVPAAVLLYCCAVVLLCSCATQCSPFTAWKHISPCSALLTSSKPSDD